MVLTRNIPTPIRTLVHSGVVVFLVSIGRASDGC